MRADLIVIGDNPLEDLGAPQAPKRLFRRHSRRTRNKADRLPGAKRQLSDHCRQFFYDWVRLSSIQGLVQH